MNIDIYYMLREKHIYCLSVIVLSTSMHYLTGASQPGKMGTRWGSLGFERLSLGVWPWTRDSLVPKFMPLSTVLFCFPLGIKGIMNNGPKYNSRD